MRKTTFTFIWVFIILITLSCKASDRQDNGGTARKTEIRQGLSGFSKIDISGDIDVYYTQGKKYSVKVIAPQNLLRKVKTNVKNGTLSLWTDNITRWHKTGEEDDIDIYITSPDLARVYVKGSGEFEAKKSVKADQLTLLLQGSGDIDMEDVTCSNITGEVRGSGDMDINVTGAKTTRWDLKGSGDIDINQRHVDQTTVNLLGSGDIDIKFIDCGSADCRLTGSGDIKLSGQLQSLKKTETGSGSYELHELSVRK